MPNLKFSIAPTAVVVKSGKRRWDLGGFVTECQAAERAGFYAAYNGERRGFGPASGRHGGIGSPLLLGMFGLAHTTSLRFAAGLVLLPLHHPVTLTQDASIVNWLYPGRFRLSVGAGYTKDDFDAYGVRLSERGERMEIGMQAINAYRMGAPFELDGPWKGSVPQRDPAWPSVPLEVFYGAWSEAGVKRAARLADGWLTGPIRSMRWIKHLADVYRAECQKIAKQPRIVLLREACIAQTDQEAWDTLGPYILEYHRIYFERGNAYDPRFDPWLENVESAEDITLEHILPDRVLCGSVDSWLETIAEWQELVAPEEIIVRLRYFHGPGLDIALKAMDLIGREVYS